MKKTTILVAVFMLMGIFTVTAAKPSSCPINSNTDFVYYSGSGASDLSQSWMVHFFDWWKGYNPDLDYQGLSGAQIDDCDFTAYPELDMYVQPGGDAYLAQKWIGADGKAVINDFIANGGSYFGACAGWYYAAGDYYWQDSYYDHSDLLGAYPGTVEGSIREIADWDGNPTYSVSALDNGLNALYWGGPTMGYEYTPAIVGELQASYVYGNLPAVVKYNNMLLTSVHLEAYENDGFTGLTTEEREANYRYLANLINEVAGTSFNVPEPPQPPTYECSDGIDNDGDLLVDFPADPDCESATDDSEEEIIIPPGPAFEDLFESGFDWTISGPGTSWELRTDQVYEGSFSAGIKRTGAGDPTYMEHAIDLTGYSSATFEYVRKLVGLDAADDFSAEYYDNGWVAVESLGSGSENGGFVQKSFSIPTSATALRFMCEAGAVSEGCWVDNVRVIAE